MSNGTQDEFAAWGRLLRQPDALPHEGLADKDAAWDKLLDRLGEKPRRPSYGYYIAAACILIFLVPTTRLFQTRPLSGRVPSAIRQEVRPPAASPRIAPPPVATPPAAKPETPAPLSPQSPRPGRQIHPGGALRPTTIEPAIYQPKNTPPEIAQTISLPVRPGPPASDPLQPPLHPQQGQTPAVKKQWRVVDLNELDAGRQQPHVMATNRKPLLLRIGLGSGNAETNFGTATSQSYDDNPLKINLTTQNP